MSQISNDCKGLTYVANDAGQIMFRRPEVTATGNVNQTAAVVVSVPGWVGLSCLDLYATIATGTGVVTLPTSSTATTGPERLQ